MAATSKHPGDPDLARWLDELRAQKRSRYTIKHYGLTLRTFHKWLREELKTPTALARVNASQLKQYQIWLSTRKGYAKNTLYITIKGLQAFYKFLKQPVADDLKPPKRGQGLPKYLTEAEAKRLVSVAADHPRNLAVVTLLLYSGLRVGELCRLQTTDLDFEDGTVRVRSGKGDKDRLVIVPQTVTLTLKNWLAQRPPSEQDHLFPGRFPNKPLGEQAVQRLVLKKARLANLEKKVTPHVLRHTLATTLLRRGGDIRFIQRILGHASIATTQIYTHLDDAELRRMYEKARPDFG